MVVHILKYNILYFLSYTNLGIIFDVEMRWLWPRTPIYCTVRLMHSRTGKNNVAHPVSEMYKLVAKAGEAQDTQL